MLSVQEEAIARRDAQKKKEADGAIARLNEIAAWQAPKVEEGADVLWFEFADPMRQAYVGSVVKVKGRFVDVYLHGALKASVRHIDDPSLVDNANHRENGAWDFAPSYKTAQEERRVLLERLDQIEARQTVIENELGIHKQEEAAAAAPSLPDPVPTKHKK